MYRFQPPVRPVLFALALGAALGVVGSPLGAQQDPDFLFERPTLRLELRAGVALPRARSQVFDFTAERLTLEPSDLRSPVLSAGLGYRVSEQLDVALELGAARAEIDSRFREWEHQTGEPIRQTTTFTRVPFTVTLRGYLWDRGRSVGRFVWIPRSFAPYVGGGAGWAAYEFTQTGEFVDFETLDIFQERFRSSASGPVVHALAGADATLGPRLVLTGEIRYSWASAPMDQGFEGFEDIDLSGFRATVGLAIRR